MMTTSIVATISNQQKRQDLVVLSSLKRRPICDFQQRATIDDQEQAITTKSKAIIYNPSYRCRAVVAPHSHDFALRKTSRCELCRPRVFTVRKSNKNEQQKGEIKLQVEDDPSHRNDTSNVAAAKNSGESSRLLAKPAGPCEMIRQ